MPNCFDLLNLLVDELDNIHNDRVENELHVCSADGKKPILDTCFWIVNNSGNGAMERVLAFVIRKNPLQVFLKVPLHMRFTSWPLSIEPGKVIVIEVLAARAEK